MTSHAIALLAVGACVCACQQPFLEASGKFATAVDASAATMGNMTALAGDLCQHRARLDYTFKRFKGPVTLDGKRLRWSEYYEAAVVPVVQRDGSVTDQSWRAHCTQIATGDALVGKALAVLGDYATALGTITSADYEGKDEAALVSDTASLVQQLSHGPPSKTTSVVAALGDPVAGMAHALEHAYAEKQAKEIVRAAAPALDAILTSLASYQEGVAEELADLENLEDEVVREGDHAARAESLDAITLQDISWRWRAELVAAKSSQIAIADALTQLKIASTALAAAASQKQPQPADLKTVLHAAATTAKDIKAVRGAFRDKGGGA